MLFVDVARWLLLLAVCCFSVFSVLQIIDVCDRSLPLWVSV